MHDCNGNRESFFHQGVMWVIPLYMMSPSVHGRAALHMLQTTCVGQTSASPCNDWKDKQSFYTWHWNEISSLDQRKVLETRGTAGWACCNSVRTTCVWERRGLWKPKWEYFCWSSLQSPAVNHSVHWAYKWVLCSVGMWNAYLDSLRWL